MNAPDSTCPPTLLTRRRFLGTGALALAGGVFFPHIARSNPLGANERIRIGIIGCGGISGGHRGFAGTRKDLLLAAVCDVRPEARERALVEARKNNPDCQGYVDYGDLVARDDIDAVMVLTPDHWHAAMAIDAMRAGKDIYVEKPMALTMHESAAMVAAAARYGRVVQVGSQQRSSPEFRRAAEIVRNGWIGRVREVHCRLGEFPPEKLLPEEPVPEGFDYDRWLGPAPFQPFNRERVKGNFGGGWRIFWDYGSRKNGDWGAHHFDIVQWALGCDDSGPVLYVPKGHDGAPQQYHQYADGTRVIRDAPDEQWMIRFVGDEGEVGVTRMQAPGGGLMTKPTSLAGRLPGPSEVRLEVSRQHNENWIECIRTRRRTICPASVGHRTFTICALSGVAERLGRPLRWDPAAETILDDPAAARFADYPRRAGYPLPS